MQLITFEKATLKKVFWTYIIISLIILVFAADTLLSILAFSLGVVLGCIKLLVLDKLSRNIVDLHKKRLSLLNIPYFLVVFFIYAILAFSVVNGVHFFIFVASGFILINIVIFFNSILELLGLTKNNY